MGRLVLRPWCRNAVAILVCPARRSRLIPPQGQALTGGHRTPEREHQPASSQSPSEPRSRDGGRFGSRRNAGGSDMPWVYKRYKLFGTDGQGDISPYDSICVRDDESAKAKVIEGLRLSGGGRVGID